MRYRSLLSRGHRTCLISLVERTAYRSTVNASNLRRWPHCVPTHAKYSWRHPCPITGHPCSKYPRTSQHMKCNQRPQNHITHNERDLREPPERGAWKLPLHRQRRREAVAWLKQSARSAAITVCHRSRRKSRRPDLWLARHRASFAPARMSSG